MIALPLCVGGLGGRLNDLKIGCEGSSLKITTSGTKESLKNLPDDQFYKPQERHMGSTTDKIKGHANQAVGKAKEKIGQATGSGQTETQGYVDVIKGKAQVAAGRAKDAVKKAVD